MRFSFALVRQHETFDKKSFYNYLNLSALSRIYLKILHCSTSRGRGGGMQGGDILSDPQLSIFIQLMQIQFGYMQPIVAGNVVSNRNHKKWDKSRLPDSPHLAGT